MAEWASLLCCPSIASWVILLSHNPTQQSQSAAGDRSTEIHELTVAAEQDKDYKKHHANTATKEGSGGLAPCTAIQFSFTTP